MWQLFPSHVLKWKLYPPHPLKQMTIKCFHPFSMLTRGTSACAPSLFFIGHLQPTLQVTTRYTKLQHYLAATCQSPEPAEHAGQCLYLDLLIHCSVRVMAKSLSCKSLSMYALSVSAKASLETSWTSLLLACSFKS